MDLMMFKMATKMWFPAIMMGLMVVLGAFIVGAWNSSLLAEYFANSKEVREAAVTGSRLVDINVISQSIATWLPPTKFVGMGMLFMGITFALASIALTIKNAGILVQERVGGKVVIPPKPMHAKLFPMFMMAGMMILFTVLGVAIWLNGTVIDYWNHSIATELNPAQTGSVLLGQLQLIASTKAWLVPLKFLGVTSLLVGISLALFTIRYTLRTQSIRMLEILETKERG